MGIFDRAIKTKERTLENPNAPVSADDFLHIARKHWVFAFGRCCTPISLSNLKLSLNKGAK